jgi:hypothetical protein
VAKTKTARWVVKLPGRNAQIHEDAIYSQPSQLLEKPFQGTEVSMHKTHLLVVLSKMFCRLLKRLGVSVNGQHMRTGSQKGCAVSAETNRSIHEPLAWRRRKGRHNFSQQDRCMSWRQVRHRGSFRHTLPTLIVGSPPAGVKQAFFMDNRFCWKGLAVGREEFT